MPDVRAESARLSTGPVSRLPSPVPKEKEIPFSPGSSQTEQASSPTRDPMAEEELAQAYVAGVFEKTGQRQPKPNRFEAQALREFVISIGVGGDGIRAATARAAFIRDTAGDYAVMHRGRVLRPDGFMRWLASDKPDPNVAPWDRAKAESARAHAPASPPAIAAVLPEPPLSPEETVRQANAFADALGAIDAPTDAQSGVHATVRKSDPPPANDDADDGAKVSA